jgi:hypothetical protein
MVSLAVHLSSVCGETWITAHPNLTLPQESRARMYRRRRIRWTLAPMSRIQSSGRTQMFLKLIGALASPWACSLMGARS